MPAKAAGSLAGSVRFHDDVPGGYEREVANATDTGAFEFGAPEGIFADGFAT